jgi:hypothetical protein
MPSAQDRPRNARRCGPASTGTRLVGDQFEPRRGDLGLRDGLLMTALGLGIGRVAPHLMSERAVKNQGFEQDRTATP